MKKEYKAPKMQVKIFDANEIILTSGGNVLKSGSYNSQSGVTESAVFNNVWISSSFEDLSNGQ